MSDAERIAIDAAMNAAARDALTHLLVALTIVSVLWLLYQKAGMPKIDIRKYWTWKPREVSRDTPQPAADYVTPSAPAAAPKLPAQQHCATPETRNNGVAMGETERNLLLRRGQAKALAKLIEAGKVSETEGLKIVYGVSPGSSQAYRDVRALLKEMQAPEYPALTADGRPIARALRTGVK